MIKAPSEFANETGPSPIEFVAEILALTKFPCMRLNGSLVKLEIGTTNDVPVAVSSRFTNSPSAFAT